MRLGTLDHFKRINDTHGPMVGDYALVEAARRVSSSVRTYDSVGRFGGEEFLIVLPGCDAATAGEQAERIRRRICREPLDFPAAQIGLSASIGAASTRLSGLDNADALIHAADLALYQAKRAGRNRVQVYGGEVEGEDVVPTFTPFWA